MDNCNNNVM